VVDSIKKTEHGPEAMLPLTPAMFHTLLADGEHHGYGIMQETAVQPCSWKTYRAG